MRTPRDCRAMAAVWSWPNGGHARVELGVLFRRSLSGYKSAAQKNRLLAVCQGPDLGPSAQPSFEGARRYRTSRPISNPAVPGPPGPSDAVLTATRAAGARHPAGPTGPRHRPDFGRHGVLRPAVPPACNGCGEVHAATGVDDPALRRGETAVTADGAGGRAGMLGRRKPRPPGVDHERPAPTKPATNQRLRTLGQRRRWLSGSAG